MQKSMLLTGILVLGCGAEAYSVEDCGECSQLRVVVEESVAPPTYSFDPSIPTMNQEVARDVFAAWCEAVGYCPREISWEGWDNDGAIYWELDYERHGRVEGSVAFLNGGHPMILDGNSPTMQNVHRFWFTFAHEVGHYRIRGHRDQGLMVERLTEYEIDSRPLEIDPYTIKEWNQF